MYDLYAVSNHYGGLGGGHYTAYCQVEGQWCNFDDTSAKPMDPADLTADGARESAYVLFYRRQAEAGGLGIQKLALLCAQNHPSSELHLQRMSLAAG